MLWCYDDSSLRFTYDDISLCYDDTSLSYDNSLLCYDIDDSSLCYDDTSLRYDDTALCYGGSSLCYDDNYIIPWYGNFFINRHRFGSKKAPSGARGGDILWRMFSKFIHRNLKQTYKYFSLDFFFKFYIKPGVAKRPVHMHADLIAYVTINRKINHNFINQTTFKLMKNNSLLLNESRSILHF